MKALKAAHTIEATPERSTPRRAASIEEAVTTRIMNRAREGEPMQEQPEAQPEQIEMPAAPVVPHKMAEVVVFKTLVPQVRKSKSTYQHRVAQDTRQMSLL